MSFSERLNSISRFIIYYFTFLALYTNNFKNMLYAILLLILIYYIYYSNNNLETYNLLHNKHIDNIDNINNINNTDNDNNNNNNHKYNRKTKYTISTKNNPFMNILLNELSDGERKPADYCDKNIETNFSNNLYSDIDDIFNRKISSRQFYTNPVTTNTNNQT